jgi:ketosteroid isomerase-like protein
VDERRQATVDRYFDALASLDADAFVAAFAPDGVAVEYHGIDVFDIDDDGRIRRLWAYWDPRELFAQLKAGR